MHLVLQTFPHSFTTFLMAFFLLFVNGQTKDPPGKKKLTVNDFKGTPNEKEDFLAKTFLIMSLEYFNPVSCREKGKVRLTVETKVTVGEKSWMKFERIKNQEMLNNLLSHEQGHYNIGAAFAKDLKDRISTTCFDKNNYKIQADSIFRSMNSYYDSLQKKYDVDTDHMRKKYDRNGMSLFRRN